MKKILIIALAAFFGTFASGASAQTFANRAGKLILGGNGGTDLTNTLTLTTTGVFGAPKTYTFPVPALGLFHSDASGGLTLGAVALGSNGIGGDVSGILLPANGGSGVNNGSNTLTITGGNVTITGPATISGTSSGTNSGDVSLVQNGGETYLTLAAGQILTANLINLASSTNVTGILPPLNGGTGIANVNTNTITLGGPISTSNNFTTTGGAVTIVGPFNGTPASTGNTVTYNSATQEATATTTGGNYLFNVAYGTTNAAAAAGAVINSTTTNAASNATGLAITSVATATATSTGLTVSSTGGANNYAATFTNGSVGIGTAAPNTSLDIVKDISTREFADGTALLASNDNVAFDAGTNQMAMVRLSNAAGAFTITSIAGPQNGKRITIYNASGQTMTLANQSAAAGATAANKIITSTGADLTIANLGSASLVYSAGDSRWIVQGTSNGNSGGGGGGSVANPSALVGLTAVNGVLTSAIRSDGAPALDQSIAPTWTGAHIFSNTVNINNTATLAKTFATTEVTNSTAFAATQDNVVFDGGTNQFNFVHLGGAPAAAFTITSIANPVSGKRLTIYNITGQTMVLANQSSAAGATAANKIITGTGADISIPTGGVAGLVYSASDSRWIVGSSSNGNGSSPVTGILFAHKTANVSLTASNTNLQTDPDLKLTLLPNATYEFSGVIVYNGAASTSDLKLGVAFSGTTTSIRWSAIQGGTALAPSSVTTAATSGTAGTVGTDILSPFTSDATFANELTVLVTGIIQVGATGGTLQILESQASSQATQTSVRLNSTFKATRVQ